MAGFLDRVMASGSSLDHTARDWVVDTPETASATKKDERLRVRSRVAPHFWPDKRGTTPVPAHALILQTCLRSRDTEIHIMAYSAPKTLTETNTLRSSLGDDYVSKCPHEYTAFPN